MWIYWFQSKCGSNIPKTGDPKPMIDNPNASATKTSNLIRPTPLKKGDVNDEGRDIQNLKSFHVHLWFNLQHYIWQNECVNTYITSMHGLLIRRRGVWQGWGSVCAPFEHCRLSHWFSTHKPRNTVSECQSSTTNIKQYRTSEATTLSQVCFKKFWWGFHEWHMVLLLFTVSDDIINKWSNNVGLS